jgi:hypothetical protein
MAFQLSPGVLVTETDLTNIVPAVATSSGAFAGVFAWGPVMDPTQITSENRLVQLFGKPGDLNAASWFTAANFLSYTNNLQLVRVDADNARNAVATQSGTVASPTIVAGGSGYAGSSTVVFGAPNIAGGTQATGTVTVADVETGSSSEVRVTDVELISGGANYTDPTITFSAPAGGGAAATGEVVVDGTNQITEINVLTPGSYAVGDTIVATIADPTGTNAVINVVTTTIVTPIITSGVITAITITEAGSGYTSAPSVTIANGGSGVGFSATTTVALAGVKINNEDFYLTTYVNGAGVVGEFAAKYPGTLGNSIRVEMADAASFTAWTYASEFDGAPGTSSFVATAQGSGDELHIIVIDEDGAWTGTQGAVLEKFAFASKASDAKLADGTNNFYKEVLNTNSKYVWWMDHPTEGTNWGTSAAGKTFVSLGSAVARSLSGGVDDFAPTDGKIQAGFGLFANAELFDVSLIPTGPVSATVAKYVVEQIAQVRRDCVAFVSPVNSTGQVIQGASILADTLAFRTQATFNVNSSFGVLDSGWKYQYDRFNDVYRWVPLNGDVAGLCARTDFTNDAWFSPGGLNRGQIKNVVKLNFSPSQAERDELYKAGINPVVSFPGQGTVLFGDKTLLTKPSAFDRINVRRLFIVLEKAIATAAKFQLFEFNDGFTRAQFRSLVEPFLRDVQGRRGVTDFRVVCDETNNSGEVIDRNEFVADIYIKPSRAINFITLNFIAARTGISFDEIGA